MESSKIEVFMLQHQNKFASEDHSRIRAELKKIPDECMSRISTASYKSPTTTLLLACFLGLLGGGAFYVKKMVYGFSQILTNLVIFVISIVSIFVIAMVIGDGSNWLLGVVFYITYIGFIIEALVLFVISIVKARKWTYEFNLIMLNKAMTSL